MKKILIYISVILLGFFFCSCTDTLTEIQTKSFVKFYGSYQVDKGEDVQILADGGYAITGSLNPDSITKMVLILTDEYGNQSQGSPICFGGDHGSRGKSLLVHDDGFLLGGEITDTLADGQLHTDIYLVRTNSRGDVIWSAQFGESGDDAMSHIIERSGGGYVIAGKIEQGNQYDIWVIMVDETGNLLYELRGNNVIDENDEANFIYNTGDGYLVACTYNDGAYDGTDLLTLYIDENCNINDSRSIGTDFDDQARVISAFDDEYIIAGYTFVRSGSGDEGFYEIGIYSFSIDGNFIKNQQTIATISQSGADLTIEGCTLNSKGELAIVGTIEVNENRDILLFLMDEEKNLILDEEGEAIIYFGDEGAQSGSSVRKTLDGGLVIAGSNSLEGNSVITLVKTDARGKL